MASYLITNNKGFTGRFVIPVLPWLVSLVLVVFFAVTILFLQNTSYQQEDRVTVRKLDVALPPPPPPPPIEIRKPQADSPAPSIDVVGSGQGPSMHFSDKPELAMFDLEKIEKPEFDLNSLDLQKTLSLDFPIVEVKELDALPRAITNVSVSYPKSLVKRGIKRVPTKVELIIDQRGKAYVKKIVDPVYPEMVEPIREWVAKVQFTIPTKNGRPIQAIYLYTIVFLYRI